MRYDCRHGVYLATQFCSRGSRRNLLRANDIGTETAGNQQGTTPYLMVEIDEDRAGQHLNNFLLSQLKGVPKTRVYR